MKGRGTSDFESSLSITLHGQWLFLTTRKGFQTPPYWMRLMPASFDLIKHTPFILSYTDQMIGCHCTFSRARLSEGVTSWADDAPVTLWWRLALTQRWRHQWLHFPTRGLGSTTSPSGSRFSQKLGKGKSLRWTILSLWWSWLIIPQSHHFDLFYLRALTLTRFLTVARTDHRDHRMIFPEL